VNINTKCIAIDFDFCSATFKNGFAGLYAIFEKRGVPNKKARSLYQEAKNLGLTIETYQRLVEQEFGPLPNRRNINQEFQDWLEKTLTPYPDAPHAFALWHTKIPIIFVTSGDNTYQLQKIVATDLPYTEIRFVKPANTKLDVVRELLLRYGAQLVFIEDKPSELDTIRNNNIQKELVRTVRILRSDSPYASVPSEYSHEEVHSLLDIRV
jgi:hypothetical protein